MKPWRLIIPIVLIVGVAAVGFVLRDRLTGNASDLQVGDCFQVPAGDSVSDVQHTPCSEPHDGEVIRVADYTGSDSYPTTDQFDTWVSSECVDTAFTSYVGTAYDTRADIDLGYFYPQADGWSSGDRQMICYLSPADGSLVSTSYRASSP